MQRSLAILHPQDDPRDQRLDIQDGNLVPDMALVRKAYRLVWAGNVDVDGSANPSPQHRLEALYAMVERGGDDCPIPRRINNPNSIRSFMVGDVVILDGVAYYCADFGWEPVAAGNYREVLARA